jgi:hypothetical protein
LPSTKLYLDRSHTTRPAAFLITPSGSGAIRPRPALFGYRGAVAVIAVLLLAVIAPVWISSDRIYNTTVRQNDVQAVAEHWASNAGWSVTGVDATGDRVLVGATGPNPAPDLGVLRRDLDAAGLKTAWTCGSAWSQPAISRCQGSRALEGHAGASLASRAGRCGPRTRGGLTSVHGRARLAEPTPRWDLSPWPAGRPGKNDAA